MHINLVLLAIYQLMKITQIYFPLASDRRRESFIYLGWQGLLIAFFAGIIFSFIEKLHHKANIICFSFYIYLVYFLATSDVYFALIPSIVQAIITFLVLLTVLFFTKKISKYL